MKPDIQLIRNMGLARLPLIGGRYDGGEWVAVVGAPICIPVKPTPEKRAAVNGYMTMSFQSIFGGGNVEGDEWKAESTKSRPENRTQRFALYAPKIDNGRASLALYFVEEVEL